MDFFEKMKGKITDTSYNTVKKAKELSETTKLNMAISESKTKIIEIYGQIGSEIYKTYKDRPLPEVEELMQQLTELYQAIEACELRIKAIAAANICPKCGTKIKQGVTFCSACGFKLQDEESEEKTLFCSKCGSKVNSDATYCSVCGNKVEHS